MKKTTTITYNIENNGDVSMSEIEYKDYVKNEKGEENLLHYKAKNVKNNNIIKAITDDASSTKDIAETDISETFNKIYKLDDTIDETVGVSSNNDDWKIHEYKNHKLDKEYKQGYDTIKFDIKKDIFENYGKNSYIKDK
jgi:TusA-related sulfurtransferase